MVRPKYVSSVSNNTYDVLVVYVHAVPASQVSVNEVMLGQIVHPLRHLQSVVDQLSNRQHLEEAKSHVGFRNDNH